MLLYDRLMMWAHCNCAECFSLSDSQNPTDLTTFPKAVSARFMNRCLAAGMEHQRASVRRFQGARFPRLPSDESFVV